MSVWIIGHFAAIKLELDIRFIFSPVRKNVCGGEQGRRKTASAGSKPVPRPKMWHFMRTHSNGVHLPSGRETQRHAIISDLALDNT